jgi:hypothetical protein
LTLIHRTDCFGGPLVKLGSLNRITQHAPSFLHVQRRCSGKKQMGDWNMIEPIRELSAGELELVSGGKLFGHIVAVVILVVGGAAGAAVGGLAAAAATGGVGTPVGVLAGGAIGVGAGAALDDALGLN